MSVSLIAFYFFGIVTLLSALFILLTKNVLYAAFALLGTFLGVAALYVLAGADFIAVTQIMVYVGGILVLMLFGIMLTNRAAGQWVVSQNINRFWGLLLTAGVLFIMIYVITMASFASIPWIKESQVANNVVNKTTIPTIGINMMTNFVLPFEVAGILLLAALIGAAHVAGKKD